MRYTVYDPPTQAVTVITGLTLARDEVLWLFKHNNVTVPKAKHRPNPDDYSDSALPELLFNMIQLKGALLDTVCMLQQIIVFRTSYNFFYSCDCIYSCS